MDIFNEMTKAELIEWVKSQWFFTQRPPQKSDVLFLRWQRKSKAISEKHKENITRGETLELKKRDEYAKLFNESKNADERMRLLKKMEPFDKALSKYMAESEKLMDADESIYKLYVQYKAELKKEAERRDDEGA